MKKVIPFTLVLIFIMGMVLTPPVGELDFIQEQVLREDTNSTLSEGVSRNIRVAVYDESNTTAPSWASFPFYTNNITPTIDLMTTSGFDVSTLTTNDILNHRLMTADFDVFVMIDNVPKDEIVDYVYEYWLSGGGIMSFNAAFGFLFYSGIFVPEWAGSDQSSSNWIPWSLGPGSAGDYINHTVMSRHSMGKSYHPGDIIEERFYDTVVSNPAISGTSSGPDLTVFSDATPGGFITGWALDPSSRAGGRVVQLPGNGTAIASGWESVIIDSVDWLAPRPKARIAWDLSHEPRLGVDPWDTMCDYPGYFDGTRDLFEMSGYTVDKLYAKPTGNLTLNRLSHYDMLILVSPDYNFTASEITAVRTWIANGGGLLALGESPVLSSFEQTSDQINWLLSDFDMQLGPYTHVTSVTGYNAEHPLADDASSITYGAVGFVNYSGDAFQINYEDSNTYIAGQEIGEGRAVLAADMNFVSNAEFVPNARFIRNLACWLTAAEAKVLYFTNEPDFGYGMTAGDLALNDLGVKHYMVTSETAFNMSLYMYSWDLVIVDAPWTAIPSYLDDINNYLDTGGKLIMSYYFASIVPTHPIWSRIGFATNGSIGTQEPTFIWESNHPLFNIPNNYNAANFTPSYDYGTEGDYLFVFDNATAIAGQTETEEVGNATIVLGLNNRVLYNAYLIDEYQGDLDDSTYMDALELWQNEIAFMLQPTIDHPSDVTYVEGTTGNTISWSPSSETPWSYSIERNSVTVDSGGWSGGEISVDIDGLTNGTYSFEITVLDNVGYSVSDVVNVNVTAAPTNTTDGGGGAPLDLTTLLIIVAAGGVVLIIIIVIVMKKKK